MLHSINLKYKLIIGGITAVFIPFFIAGIVIYYHLSHSLQEIAHDKSMIIAQDVAGLINAALRQEIKLAEAIAANPIIIRASQTGRYQEARRMLEMVYQRIGKTYFTMFLLDRHGTAQLDAFFTSNLGLNLSDRDYFRKAQSGHPSISGPIASRSTYQPGSPVIVISAPIINHDQFLGLIGIAFNMDFLSEILNRKKSGKTGYAFLIDSEGLILAHPNQDHILKTRLPKQTGIDTIAAVMPNSQPGTTTFSWEGIDLIAGIAGVDQTNWIAVFSQSRQEIMDPLNRIIFFLMISGIGYLVITLAMIIGFSGRITPPIMRMMEIMKQMTLNSAEIILQIGLDRRITYANPAFVKISGFPIDRILGRIPVLANLIHISEETIWNSLESGNPWSGRITLQRADATTVTLDVLILPLRNDRGTIQGYLEIGLDVTSELIFEKRLQQAQKLEAIGTLASGIAHDFNNILSGIFGYAELSLLDKDSPVKTEGYAREIIKASERARDLVSQILTFSRKTDIELIPLQPQIVLKEALKLLRASIPSTIAIETNINSFSFILGEPTQLHQIIMNLFTNAVHAIGSRIGTIRLELEDFMVNEEFTALHPGIHPGNHIIIRVSDTGCGIPPELLDRVFDPFFTTKSPGEGTGLGLSVVDGIVKKMDGIITVYSEIGKGIQFNIIIPCTATHTMTNDPENKHIRQGTERIAVIDDETAILKTLKSILSNFGYRITTFSDSRQALDSLNTDSDLFDLLIIDYSMPHLTGLELIKNLRQQGNQIPVILTSGYISQEIEQTARTIDINEIMTKPISIYRLAEAIQRVLAPVGRVGL
ncbi:MAG: response regulator [Candidatus Delongbacteria bacterium]|nr:response regulator [Candidatus Delongbacteria bacterium]